MGAFGAGVFGAGIFGIGETDTPIVERPKESRFTSPKPLTCRVINQAGQWAYLNNLGKTTGLTFTSGYPGGSQSAEVSVDAPPDQVIPALVEGATFEVIRGASIGWRGRIASIVPGSPRRVQVDGLAGLATREVAITTGTLDAIVDASITDGLPWTRPAMLTSGWSTTDNPITTTLDEVLTSGLAVVGKRWTVSNQGVVASVTDPTGTPTLQIRVSDPIPTSLNKYATIVHVHYLSSTTGQQATAYVTDPVAKAKYGRVVAEVTVSPYASYTAAGATALGNAYLARVTPRLTLTGAFTVTNGQIVTTTGAPVDLADTEAIRGRLARLQFATPLRDALLGSVMAFDTVIGEVTYNDDDATLSIAPVDAGLTPAQILFGGRGGGDYVSPYR